MMGVPSDDTLWHRWHVFWPVRTVDGRWAMMDVWRKRDGGKWLYQRRPMSDEEQSGFTTY